VTAYFTHWAKIGRIIIVDSTSAISHGLRGESPTDITTALTCLFLLPEERQQLLDLFVDPRRTLHPEKLLQQPFYFQLVPCHIRFHFITECKTPLNADTFNGELCYYLEFAVV
jgi:hypothetical protein